MYEVKEYLYNFVFDFGDGLSNNIWATMSEDRKNDIEIRFKNRTEEVKLKVTRASEVDSFDITGYHNYTSLCRILQLDC